MTEEMIDTFDALKGSYQTILSAPGKKKVSLRKLTDRQITAVALWTTRINHWRAASIRDTAKLLEETPASLYLRRSYQQFLCGQLGAARVVEILDALRSDHYREVDPLSKYDPSIVYTLDILDLNDHQLVAAWMLGLGSYWGILRAQRADMLRTEAVPIRSDPAAELLRVAAGVCRQMAHFALIAKTGPLSPKVFHTPK